MAVTTRLDDEDEDALCEDELDDELEKLWLDEQDDDDDTD